MRPFFELLFHICVLPFSARFFVECNFLGSSDKREVISLRMEVVYWGNSNTICTNNNKPYWFLARFSIKQKILKSIYMEQDVLKGNFASECSHNFAKSQIYGFQLTSKVWEILNWHWKFRGKFIVPQLKDDTTHNQPNRLRTSQEIIQNRKTLDKLYLWDPRRVNIKAK
jgi:hypothetical protein